MTSSRCWKNIKCKCRICTSDLGEPDGSTQLIVVGMGEVAILRIAQMVCFLLVVCFAHMFHLEVEGFFVKGTEADALEL